MSTTDQKKVDLVIAIDTSNSMKDEAKALNAALSKALKEASTACPSDIRIEFLGIEGTFAGTKFDKTVRGYLTTTAGADDNSLKGRKLDTVANAGAQEDLARVVEDISTYYDWRDGAEKNVFVLGDEGLEGGGVKVKPAHIKACDNAIATALNNTVKVHTYLGTPSVPYPTPQDEEANIKEYQRLALQTGGEYSVYTQGVVNFAQLLKDIICASKVPQEESIVDKKDEVDKLEGKTPASSSDGACNKLCEKLPEIVKAVNTLNEMLKGLVEACGPHGAQKGCGCQDGTSKPEK